MAALFVQCDHRLEVVAFDNGVAGALRSRSVGELGNIPRDPWADQASQAPGIRLAGKIDSDPPLTIRLQKFEELVASQILNSERERRGRTRQVRHGCDRFHCGPGTLYRNLV